MAIRKVGKYFQIDYYDPNGKRIRKNFKMKKDAVAEHAKRQALIAENRYLDVKTEYNTTLAELIDVYVSNFHHQTSFKTHKVTYLENFKEYFGADTLLIAIRYVDLETYQSHLKQKLTVGGTIRKPGTINREMFCLHQLFTKAVEWEMIPQSPFERGKALRLKENNERMRFLDEVEIETLLDACKSHLYPIVLCALTTGMRRGEILSLKWSQVRNGFIYLRKTKTFNSRQIPISDRLADLFKEIRKREHLRSEYVFTYAGNRLTTNHKAFHAAMSRAEINDFTFHDLRHTFASQVLLRGGSLKDIQELLGHKDIRTTMRYAHLTQQSKIDAVNLLNGIGKNPDSHKMVTKIKPAIVTN